MGGPTYFLTINAGSSSIKFSLFNSQTLNEDYTGTLSGIGFDIAVFKVRGNQEITQELPATDKVRAIEIIRNWLQENTAENSLAAIGHRIVHGGPKFTSSCELSPEVVDELKRLIPLDTEHLPTQISMIEILAKMLPGIPQLASFDTTFFHDLPTVSRLLPLPRWLEKEGIRRYGFHGISYSYLLKEFEKVAGHEAARGNIIFAHLGNGASLAAVKDGQPIDTSMGLTPAGGIPMSSRSGDIDPGVITYLSSQYDFSPEHISHIIGFESGLLGMSETTSDMKKLLDVESSDTRARDAVDIFCYIVRKYIGAYAAAMGGINSIIFSGGIGEVSAPIRRRICDKLQFLGISLDDERNQASAECISSDGAGVGVHVLKTNEALEIARDMQRLLQT